MLIKIPYLVCLLLLSARLLAAEPIQPLSLDPDLNPGRVALGDLLFHDPRLSADNSTSCASCHDLKSNGSDSLPRSKGINGREGSVKAPTVFNSGLNFVQFWDGRSRTLEAQVEGPVHNPVEMGSNWDQIIGKLAADPEVNKQFQTLYSDGLTPANIRDAIATFERSLVTTGSRFDRWLLGDKTALSANERDGYRLFKAYGCISCHQGRNVGGNMYAYMGSMRNYFADRGVAIEKSDLGRFNVTGNPDDKHLFKVPSLRLASLQKYFFHDGSVDSLGAAVQVMARYQLGREISNPDLDRILAFLHTLTGLHPKMVAE